MYKPYIHMKINSLRFLKIYGQFYENFENFLNSRYAHALARCVHDPHTLSYHLITAVMPFHVFA